MTPQQILMAAAEQGSGGSSGPTELFPDPTLADVTDGTNGWFLGDGFSATSGTGPGISLTAADADNICQLVGTDEAAFLANVGVGVSKTVAITAPSVIVGNILTVSIREGDPVPFDFSASGTISHTVVSGSAGAGAGFIVTNTVTGTTLNLSHFSVT
jgi:hypothetical protein